MCATHPSFLEPSDEDDSGLDRRTTDTPPSGSPGSPGRQLSLATSTGEPLVITNFEAELPIASTVTDRNNLVRAGTRMGIGVDADALYAVARGVTQPALAAEMIKGRLLIDETVGTAHLDVLYGRILSTEVLPLQQARTEHEANSVRRPKVSGVLADDGTPLATLRLIYRDQEHLREHLKETVIQTRRSNKYDASILARRVGRPIIVHTARIEFEDGSEPIYMLVVRDGLTRVVSSWAARLEPEATPEDIAEHMAEKLLAVKVSARSKNSSASQQHALGREKVAEDLRARFIRGIGGATPSEEAIRIGQTFTLPAQIYLGVRQVDGIPLPPDAAFDDAIRSVVSSVHVEFKGWEPAAAAVELGDRAMLRVRCTGELRSEVVDLASGALPVSSVPEIFGDPSIPPTALWRAIYLVSSLCSRKAFTAIKREIRALTGWARVSDVRYAGLLGPIIDRPWRGSKSRTLQQARRAWSNGGPLSGEILGSDWEPTPTDDFTTLVERAVNGDTDARLTLQVAGGIALICDKLLTRNVGSAEAAGDVPFRADVDDVIANLGGNEAGLWQLARAANAFQADRMALNAYTAKELSNEPALATNTYLVPKVDPAQPSRIALDNAGAAAPLREYDVVRLSDPEKAADAEQAQASQARAKKKKVVKNERERAADLRRSVKTGLAEVQESINALLTIGSGSDGSFGSPFGTYDQWQALHMATSSIFASIMANQPPLSTGTILDTDTDTEAGTEAEDFDDELEDGE